MGEGDKARAEPAPLPSRATRRLTSVKVGAGSADTVAPMSRLTVRRLIVGLLLGALLALPAQAWRPWRSAAGLPPSLQSICHGGTLPGQPDDPATPGLHCALCGVLPALALPPVPATALLRQDLAAATPPPLAPPPVAAAQAPHPPARGPPLIDRA